jgi:hypothetical protein
MNYETVIFTALVLLVIVGAGALIAERIERRWYRHVLPYGRVNDCKPGAFSVRQSPDPGADVGWIDSAPK